jgi:hypothetical protein
VPGMCECVEEHLTVIKKVIYGEFFSIKSDQCG